MKSPFSRFLALASALLLSGVAAADSFAPGYDEVKCGGTAVTRRGSLNFTDVGATCTDDSANNETEVSGLGGGGTGDIESVTAGAGLTGGGLSGAVTLDIGAGTGITVNANDIEATLGTAITSSEITDGDVSAADLGVDSVSASELNATGVEAELEAVLDLPDLQGAVTDAQVPDTITISLAATATALAGNGGNCSASQAPLGVDASGAVESCTDFEEELTNSAGLLAALADETGTGVTVFSDSPTLTTGATISAAIPRVDFIDTTPGQTDGHLYLNGGLFTFADPSTANTETLELDLVGRKVYVPGLPSCDSVDTDSAGMLKCGSDATGAGGGDAITVNSAAATDPDFLNGDVDWTLTGGTSITATVGCTDCVTLATETTGNYVATIADSGNSTVTVANSGSESAAVTLNVVDLSCTNCIGPTEITDLTLTTDTAGNYVASVATAGGSLTGGAAGSEGATLTLDVGDDLIDGTELADTITTDSNLTISGNRVILSAAVPILEFEDTTATHPDLHIYAEGGLMTFADTDTAGKETLELDMVNRRVYLPGTVCSASQVLTTYPDGLARCVSASAGSGDVTDVYNCASGDCASIATTDGDLLDFSAVTVNTTTEGLKLPLYNSAGTADGQISWDATNDKLYVGDGAVAVPINTQSYFAGGDGAAADRYLAPGMASNATEANIDIVEQPIACTVTEFHAEVNTAPGAGQSWTVTLREDGGNTAKSCVIADAAVECDDNSDLEPIAAGATVTVGFIRSSANNAGFISAAWQCYAG